MTDRDTGLDEFFAAARAEAPLPSGDLLARIEAEALALQTRAATPAPGLFAQVRAALGGWPGVAGLAAACAAGIWIGVAAPAGLGGAGDTAAGLGAVWVDPLSAYDLAMMEN